MFAVDEFDSGQARDEVGAPVTIDVWNVLGQRAATLLNETLDPGVHTVNWAGANAAGVSLSSGLYFVRLHTEGNFAASKLLLIR